MDSNHLLSHPAVEALPRSLHVRFASTLAAVCIAGLLGACGGGNSSSTEPSVSPSSAIGSQTVTADSSDDSLSQAAPGELSASALAADSGRTANYFRLVKDKRTCAAPACGGVYATTMNTNVQITCPNGETSATCYIGRLDTSALGFSPFDVGNGDPVKVKGTLTAGPASAGGTRYGNLAVETVFLPAATATHLMHHLYVITNNGLECPTRLCMKYDSKLANRSRSHTVSSFDLTKLALTAEQRRSFRQALRSGKEVLIQVGEGQTIQTENGPDVREGVNGLFLPVVAPSAPAAKLSDSASDDDTEF